MTYHHQRDLLRRLADEVAEIASLPVQRERISLWTRLNDLDPVRPMVWITEIPWTEFEDDIEELRPACEDEKLRSIELDLRRKIFTARYLATDEVVLPTWDVPLEIEGLSYGVTVAEQTIAQGSSYILSHHYKPAITDFADIEKIVMPQVVHHAAQTAERVAFFEGLFGDILPIRTRGIRQHFNDIWDTLVRFTGVTEALIDLSERPDFIHALMRRMTDNYLSRMTQLEAQQLLAPSTDLARVGSGASGCSSRLPSATTDPATIRLVDQWGGATPQIFADVSPEMHEEFALRYELETMQLCGLNYYGCCEPVHNKMHLLATVPNLRKVSISPWCDVAKTAAEARQRYVFSHKPSPALLAGAYFDGTRAKQDIIDRLEQSGPMPCEFIMKDISTVQGDVQRLIDWCRIASRLADPL